MGHDLSLGSFLHEKEDPHLINIHSRLLTHVLDLQKYHKVIVRRRYQQCEPHISF